MATYYLSSVDGSDADNGSTWALARATLVSALTLATASGDIIFVDSAHSEALASASMALTAATASTFVSIVSVNRNGSTTTGHSGRLKGAIVSTATNAFGMTIASTGAQSLYFYGILFSVNNGSSASNTIVVCGTQEATIRNVTFDNCEFSTPGTNAATLLGFGNATGSSSAAPLIILKDTLLKGHNNTGGGVFSVRNVVFFANGLTVAYNTAKPASMLECTTGNYCAVRISDSDLSAFDSGNYVIVTAFRQGFIEFVNCKKHATPGVVTGTWQTNSVRVLTINFDSADTKTQFGFYNRLGTLLATEAIYANDGFALETTHVSWQIITTAACNEAEPFVTPYFIVRRAAVSTTLSWRIAHDSLTDLTDRNLWSDTDYVSSTTVPLGTLASNRNASPFEGSAVDWPNNTDAWTGTGGFGNLNRQTIAQNFTPAEASTLRSRLIVGATSYTLYADPPVIS